MDRILIMANESDRRNAQHFFFVCVLYDRLVVGGAWRGRWGSHSVVFLPYAFTSSVSSNCRIAVKRICTGGQKSLPQHWQEFTAGWDWENEIISRSRASELELKPNSLNGEMPDTAREDKRGWNNDLAALSNPFWQHASLLAIIHWCWHPGEFKRKIY